MGPGGDKAAGEGYDAVEILKLMGSHCRVNVRFGVCGSVALVSCSNLKWNEQSGMELDNASRSEQWRRRDACDRAQLIEVDEKWRRRKSRVEPRMMAAATVRSRIKNREGWR